MILLDRRRYMERADNIPYQRIAYLQYKTIANKPNSQFIDCLYIPDGTEVFDIDFNINVQPNSSSEFSLLFGARLVAQGTHQANFWTGFNSSLSTMIRFGTVNPSSSFSISQGVNYHATIDLPNRLYTIGSNSLSFANSDIIPVERSIYLFNVNTPTAALNRSGEYRISSFKITKNNNAILDFIPVRINSTGYMYDKVSGQLFGNSGTDTFALGPDV